MNQSDTFGIPTLVVITGRPASGKTTLSHTLAQAIRCPLISRDAIKEGLINTIQNNAKPIPTDLNAYVSTFYFNTLESLLRRHISLVTEAAFQHHVWSPKLLTFHEFATVKIICCSIDPELAKTRFIQRIENDPTWSSFHDDLTPQLNTDLSQTLIGQYQPPKLDIPTLTVDTSDGYQPPFDEILSFIKSPNQQ